MDPALTISFVSSIAAIPSAQWNRLAGDDSPFLRHEFLLALETSGCTTARSGWQPRHGVIKNRDGVIVALLPLYEKDNSFGEYVFDWSWADAYRTHGLAYYPKLVTAVPFTPSTGARLLTAGDQQNGLLIKAVVDGVQGLAAGMSASSWHVLFPGEAESQALKDAGLMQRRGCQFHWFNRGYRDFDGFLGALNSRKRKNVRKERAVVDQQGIGFDVIEGPDVTPEQWERFYHFYQNTYRVRGRQGYLNLEFFLAIGQSMPDNLTLILAHAGRQPIAGALFFKSKTRLFGRYWGSLDDYRFLHFETCFYRAIDYAIQQGMAVFDAGAQGEHKIQRGFEPVPTWSNHWIAHPAFGDAIAEFLEREALYIQRYMDEAATLLPFRQESESN